MKDEISIEDAQNVLRKEQSERIRNCQTELEPLLQEIQIILQKHNCSQMVLGKLKSGAWVPISDLGFIDVQLKIIANA